MCLEIQNTCKLLECSDPVRVRTHDLVEQSRDGAPSGDPRTTTIVAVTNTREDHGFSQTEGAHEITMRIRGATMETTCISPLNAELHHRRGG